MRGARIVEGVTATGFTRANGRVTGVITDRGTVGAEFVVNAAGIWARQVGALAGVSVPLQAAEHYYLITDTVEWANPDLPVIEEPDRHGYYREEGGGILVGLFEPMAGPWSLDGIPGEVAFASLPPDWERVGPYLARAMDRVPALHEAGVRTMFCGPESFTPDIGPLLGEAPELGGFFVAAGMNSLGIILSGGVGSLIARWIVDGVPPVDMTAWGSETRIRSCGEAVILVDESAEQVPAANIARADLDRLCGRCERWSEAEGAMGPAAGVVLGVGPEGSIEMPPPLDERPVEALGPHRLDHPFRVGVGVRSPDRGADDPHFLRAEDSVKRATELRVPVADEEADGAHPSVEVQGEVPGLLVTHAESG
jgi:hypothetical protein